jgi:hypothetical protein
VLRSVDRQQGDQMSVKKSPKMEPNPFVAKIHRKILPRKKAALNYDLFIVQSKKSVVSCQTPNWRKFVQSGHPAKQFKTKRAKCEKTLANHFVLSRNRFLRR